MPWSSSSTSSNSGTIYKEWGKETDDRIRGCRIKLSRRCIGWPAYHWCVTFMWDGGYEATYEALDYNDDLTPRWKTGGPEEKTDDGTVEYVWYEWDSDDAKNCSPLEVNDKAKTVRIGDMKYALLKVNCHEWARALAWEFGVDLPPGFAMILRGGTTPTVTSNANPWGKETDDQVRGCIIKLSRRNIGGLFSYHWCLTFMWDGGYEATYEALDYNDYLTPRWKTGGPEEKSDDGTRYTWYEWGSYDAKNCSPLEVNDKAKTMRIGDMKYTVLEVNCQEWAKALAWQFDVYLPPGLIKFLRFGSKPNVTFNDDPVPNYTDTGSMLEKKKTGSIVSAAQAVIRMLAKKFFRNN